jgi:hypothetical protein
MSVLARRSTSQCRRSALREPSGRELCQPTRLGLGPCQRDRRLSPPRSRRACCCFGPHPHNPRHGRLSPLSSIETPARVAEQRHARRHTPVDRRRVLVSWNGSGRAAFFRRRDLATARLRDPPLPLGWPGDMHAFLPHEVATTAQRRNARGGLGLPGWRCGTTPPHQRLARGAAYAVTRSRPVRLPVSLSRAQPPHLVVFLSTPYNAPYPHE